MRSIFVLGIVWFVCQTAMTQNINYNKQDAEAGSLYFYWGWNRGWYTNSDIRFHGEDYDFELKEVVAKDRPTEFAVDPYFHPGRFTIPQTNFRLGYFINSNWNISFGVDHMKYVVQNDQLVEINGYIDHSSETYNGNYSGDIISIADDFLKFEHTDGLNYLNVELRRFDRIFDFNKVKVSLTEGFGIGGLLPRTNTTLLGQDKYDEFHWSGFGFGPVVGLHVSFFDHFFIQTEWKAGYINMPDIRTTMSKADRASQDFFFAQYNIVFGASLNTRKKTEKYKD